jgi:cysteine-rich repeat protein
MPVDLAFWGDFPPAAAACQRAIGGAAAACAQKTWRLRRNCDVTRLRGGVCDDDAVARAIQSTRFDAQDAVAARCTDDQARTLQFIDVREAQLDVTTFCRQLVDAARSLLLDPVTDRALPAQSAACIDRITRSASKLFSAGFVSRQRILDRIAVASFTPARKRTMVIESSIAIGATIAALDAELAPSCPAPLFADLYHQQTSTNVLVKLATRADCLAGQTYAQGGILCPTPACGNWMIERDEECDDGNTADGDGCTADCFVELPPEE